MVAMDSFFHVSKVVRDGFEERSKRMFLDLPLRRAALTLLLFSLLTACTTQSTVPPTPARQSTPITARTVPTCQTSHLTSTCTLFGYPHIQMLLADRHPTPTHAMQATSAYLFQTALKVVSLQAEAKSYFIVEWVAGTCVQYASTAGAFVQITPPGDTGILTTPARAGADGGIDACSNIVVSPVSAMNVLH